MAWSPCFHLSNSDAPPGAKRICSSRLSENTLVTVSKLSNLSSGVWIIFLGSDRLQTDGNESFPRVSSPARTDLSRLRYDRRSHEQREVTGMVVSSPGLDCP